MWEDKGAEELIRRGVFGKKIYPKRFEVAVVIFSPTSPKEAHSLSYSSHHYRHYYSGSLRHVSLVSDSNEEEFRE